MAANNQLIITELEPELIKENLKISYKTNQTFQDYNIDGSALNLHLDVLKHDTYYNAFYLNMLFNEAFLDSGVRRTSVVSRAKELGYLPRSAIGSTARLRLTIFPNDSPASILISKYTKFQGNLNGFRYYFQTLQEYTIVPVNGGYSKDIDVYEGDYVSSSHTVANDTDFLKILIQNQNIDINTLTVTVRSSENSTDIIEWKRAPDIITSNFQSEVYYLVENMDGFYEIQFAGNVLGKRPSTGNVITVSYLAVNGPYSNDTVSFSKISSIQNYFNFNIRTLQRASGGQLRENIESIRFNAPRYYTMQNRAVTSGDYKQHVLDRFSDIESIAVWGGEENNPPMYGKVCLSLKPFNGLAITDLRKEEIYTSIEDINIHTIEPVFFDPTFVYIIPTVKVHYDSKATTLSSESIRVKVAQAIEDYESLNLGVFNKSFRQSKISSLIDSADNSINSNELSFLLQKRFSPILNDKFTYIFPFHTKIYHPYDGYTSVLSTSEFTYPTSNQKIQLDDDGYGNVRAFYTVKNKKVIFKDKIGTIDYATGLLKLNSFNPSSIVGGGEMKVNIVSDSKDFAPIKNQVLLIADTTITIVDDSTNAIISTAKIATAGDTITINEVPLLKTVVI